MRDFSGIMGNGTTNQFLLADWEVKKVNVPLKVWRPNGIKFF